jgi:3-oxoacyl-[acyl-carrier protein] reductase
MTSGTFADEGLRKSIEQSIPIGRIAAPDDIALPVLFLCSEWARHITGEVLNINGGSVLCG